MRLSALRLNDQLSTNEKQFVHAAAHRGLRLDGRHISAPRPCALVVKRVSGNQSLAEATIGSTRVSAVVSAELTLPFPDRPSEGFLHVTAEVMPCASPSALNASANQELQIVEKSLKDSRAIDVEGLCVVAGSRVWAVKCQITLLNDCGSVADCASLAALAALLHFRRPEVTVAGEDCLVHSVDERAPVALAVHHVPLCISFAVLSENAPLLVDPTNVEEAVAEGRLSLVLNGHKEICTVAKSGAPLPHARVVQAANLAVPVRAQRGKVLDEAVLLEPF